MVTWWLSLAISQQIALALALASTLVLIIDVVLFTINFYGIDKLNAEPENLSKYETVANSDSDMSQKVPRLITIKNLNVLIGVSCWLYFGLWSILDQAWLIVISVAAGLFVAGLNAVIDKYIKD